ncbi:MAG: polysaccharide deacetylase family protein [Lachnospiraceae bacterium]
MNRWKLKGRVALLVSILMLDGILLGGFAGVMQFRSGQTSAVAGADPLDPKMIALTFDDGPHKIYTEELLDGLKERNARATFFLMGKNIEGNEALVKRMQDEGHLIGNHSYSHTNLTAKKEEEVCEDVEHTGQLIENIVGNKPQYLRPPYGEWNEKLECQLDLTTVFWTVDSLDWKLQNKQKIVNQVKKKANEESIILMHDIFPTSVEAALEIVDILQRQGYTFVTVDELLID